MSVRMLGHPKHLVVDALRNPGVNDFPRSSMAASPNWSGSLGLFLVCQRHSAVLLFSVDVDLPKTWVGSPCVLLAVPATLESSFSGVHPQPHSRQSLL